MHFKVEVYILKWEHRDQSEKKEMQHVLEQNQQWQKKTGLWWNTFFYSMDMQLQHAFHKALRAHLDPTETSSRRPHRILPVAPWPDLTADIYTFLAADTVFCTYWPSATIITQPVGSWLLFHYTCKNVELTRLQSGCFHVSVYPCGIDVQLTSDKQRRRTLPKGVFLPGFFAIVVQLDSHGPQENTDRNAPVGLPNGLYPDLYFGFTLIDVKMSISASYSRKSQQSDGIPPETAEVSGRKPF